MSHKPIYGETYYFITSNEEIGRTKCINAVHDYVLGVTNNCFYTEKEAKDNISQYLHQAEIYFN